MALRTTTRRHRRYRPMLRLVGRRLLWTLPLMVLISVAVFALAALSPADSSSAFLGARDEFTGGSAREGVEALIAQPHWFQAWWQWVTTAFTGDLGYSTSGRMPVLDVVGARLPWTVLLMVIGLVLGIILAVPLAVLAALRRESLIARAISSSLWALSAVPAFLVALVLVGVLSLGLGWLPAGGLTDPGAGLSVTQVVRHLALPALAVGAAQLPWLGLHLQRALEEHLDSPATRAAQLRGVSETRVLTRHVLPSAAIPVLAIAGSRLPEVVAGAVIVEQVFSWPGLGRSLVAAALAQDFALLATTTVVFTAVAVLGGLLADLGLTLADPRTDPDEL